MNRKVKSFKTTNSVFIGTYAVSNVIPSVRSPVFQPRHRPTIVLPLVYCPVNNIGPTLFEIRPEIRCSGVSGRYCYGNHAAGSKPFKNFISYQLRIEYGLSIPKIISKCYELVKLCNINRSGPVFLRHSVYTYI